MTASSRGALRLLSARRGFHTSSLRKGGMPPPLPAFKRSPRKFESVRSIISAAISCFRYNLVYLVDAKSCVRFSRILLKNTSPSHIFILQLNESYDGAWDDGVAPELGLDFDAPMVSSGEALRWTIGSFTGIFLLYQGIKYSGIVPEKPALPHAVDNVQPDYSDLRNKPEE